MSLSTNCVLLKNKTVPKDSYESTFAQNGISPTFLPVLEFQATNVDQLRDYLVSDAFLNDTPVIIITSQRSIEVVNAQLKLLDESQRKIILNKTCYTVGPATSKVLVDAGYTNVRGGIDAGNGEVLADIILQENLCSRAVFFTGEVRKDILPKKLKASNVNLLELAIYSTVEKDGIFEQFDNLIKDLTHKSTKALWIAFFSPSGTNQVLEALHRYKESDFESFQKFKIASIGPTTTAYLRSKELDPHVESSKPTASAMLEAINNFSLSS